MATQTRIPLSGGEVSEEWLRRAHASCKLTQTFEQAMQSPNIAISLKHVALVLAKKQKGKGNGKRGR